MVSAEQEPGSHLHSRTWNANTERAISLILSAECLAVRALALLVLAAVMRGGGFKGTLCVCLAILGSLAALPRGCYARDLQDLTAAGAGTSLQQQQQGFSRSQQWHWHCRQLAQQLKAALHTEASKYLSSSVSSEAVQHLTGTGVLQPQLQRSLLQFKPSRDEQHAASKHAAKMSAWHAAGVTLLCLLAMAVLGFIGHKAMQWYERARRPGYVELQALDTVFHKPTFTL